MYTLFCCDRCRANRTVDAESNELDTIGLHEECGGTFEKIGEERKRLNVGHTLRVECGAVVYADAYRPTRIVLNGHELSHVRSIELSLGQDRVTTAKVELLIEDLELHADLAEVDRLIRVEDADTRLNNNFHVPVKRRVVAVRNGVRILEPLEKLLE